MIFITLFLLALSVRNTSQKEAPPKQPPDLLLNGFTADGQIPIEYFYVDDSARGNGTHFSFSSRGMESLIAGAGKVFDRIENSLIYLTDQGLADAEAILMLLLHIPKENWIHLAMKRYITHVNNSKACVFGSMEPWVEAAAIYAGASLVYTLEYNNLTYSHPSIVTISQHGFQSFYSNETQQIGTFDVAFSISSFDHDGLGRYGDPLDPSGDLKAMQQAWQVLRPGGLLFLTLPIGPDVTIFNLMRRYGPVRLPMMLSGWTEVERLGWDEQKLVEEASWRRTYEPVFVLQKPLIETLSRVGDDIISQGIHVQVPSSDSNGNLGDADEFPEQSNQEKLKHNPSTDRIEL